MRIFVSGYFNVLHPGHFRFLEFARKQGDELIVGVFEKKDASADTLPVSERVRNLKSLDFVSDVIIIQDDLQSAIASLKPEIIVKGWEFRNLINQETEIVEQYGGKVIFSPNIYFSKSTIEKTSFSVDENIVSEAREFQSRKHFRAEDLKLNVERMSDLRIAVFGEIIIDEYVDCTAVGVSREDASVVMKPEVYNRFVGGAAVVASHARSLGAEVSFFSVAGLDPDKDFACETLKGLGVSCFVLSEEGRPTTKKTRFRIDGRSVARVNDFSGHSIESKNQELIFKYFCEVSDDFDLVIFSDFGYGVLPGSLIRKIIDHCKSRGTLVVADSQTSSQVGDLLKFSGVDYITPTEHEARMALRDNESGLVELAKNLSLATGVKHIALTLAAEGVLISRFWDGDDNAQLLFMNDTLPAFSTSPIDVSGAGDAFLVTSAMYMAVCADIWQASYIGSAAAAVQVSRTGNIPISKSELLNALIV